LRRLWMPAKYQAGKAGLFIAPVVAEGCEAQLFASAPFLELVRTGANRFLKQRAVFASTAILFKPLGGLDPKRWESNLLPESHIGPAQLEAHGMCVNRLDGFKLSAISAVRRADR